MKLLLDQNISPHLVARLADLYPGSAHVQSVGFDLAPDIPLWEYARENDFVIVTKDADFSDRSALLGYPPKVIWIRLGNCTTSEIESVLRTRYDEIVSLGENQDAAILAIF